VRLTTVDPRSQGQRSYMASTQPMFVWSARKCFRPVHVYLIYQEAAAGMSFLRQVGGPSPGNRTSSCTCPETAVAVYNLFRRHMPLWYCLDGHTIPSPRHRGHANSDRPSARRRIFCASHASLGNSSMVCKRFARSATVMPFREACSPLTMISKPHWDFSDELHSLIHPRQ